MEQDFVVMVQELWNNPKYLEEDGKLERLIWKLKDLKDNTKQWQKQCYQDANAHLRGLENDINSLLQNTLDGVITQEDETLLNIIEHSEQLWRQRSEAIWIRSDDQNINFFHNFTNFRRNRKFDWEIMDDEGNLHSRQKNKKVEVVKHFKNFFKEQGDPSTIDQVSVAAKFSRLITEVEAEVLYALIQMVELRDILSKFKVEKSPGSDGWTVEFFLHFFDLFEGDLLNMIEESRLKGNISGGLNSTFIALVPKVNKPLTFGDYGPISLYNLCYKIISKIIANRTKPILSRSLSEEQLGSFQGRQIQDAIGIVHECLHNIKKNKLKSLVLKLDLQKAYDFINWNLLRMILLQIGLGLKVTSWIMSCVVSTSFAVLINGEATDLFKRARGLRQGCPLSPLLFILVMEGVRLLLKESQREGKLAGINVSRTIKILHILFVDDVIIMTNATLQEWWEIDKILKSFCLASGLQINATKSIILQAGLSEKDLSLYKSLFPYKFSNLASGFKYLGFYLKTGPQRADGWICFLK